MRQNICKMCMSPITSAEETPYIEKFVCTCGRYEIITINEAFERVRIDYRKLLLHKEDYKKCSEQ